MAEERNLNDEIIAHIGDKAVLFIMLLKEKAHAERIAADLRTLTPDFTEKERPVRVATSLAKAEAFDEAARLLEFGPSYSSSLIK